MRVLFGAQDMFELVNGDYTSVIEKTTKVQRNMQREMRKRYWKTLFYIHQCVDMNVFKKIVDSTMEKVTWDTLVWCYDCNASVKKVKLESLCKQYKNLNMKNNKNVSDYISIVI